MPELTDPRDDVALGMYRLEIADGGKLQILVEKARIFLLYPAPDGKRVVVAYPKKDRFDMGHLLVDERGEVFWLEQPKP